MHVRLPIRPEDVGDHTYLSAERRDIGKLPSSHADALRDYGVIGSAVCESRIQSLAIVSNWLCHDRRDYGWAEYHGECLIPICCERDVGAGLLLIVLLCHLTNRG